MNQLPAYLQALQPSGLAARAAEGIGSALPPHISIRGNQFTLVDAAGNKQTAQTTFLDVCIADISDVMCKQYYENDWSPDSDDPPACWSANGVAPSVEAINPQSPLCSTCQWNVRGSDTSRLSGKAIKACRDEKWLAVLVAGVPMPLQLKLTPGSFTNWRGYTEKFPKKPHDFNSWSLERQQQWLSNTVDMCHVFTRLQFEANKNGVLTFALSPVGYIDQAVAAMYVQMRNAKASDVLVGRTDRPRLAALTGPAVTMQPQIGADGAATVTTAQTQPQGFQPAPFGGAPSAGLGTGPAASAQSATTNPATGEQQPARRRRRTAEQIAADSAAAAGGAPQGQAPASGGQAFQQPARPQTALFAQPSAASGGAPAFTQSATGTAAPFGIAQNPPPPPAGLDASLDALFNTGT